MFYGIGLLAILAILFFFGFGRSVSRFFGNDVVVLVLILFTILGNILPPVRTGDLSLYLGGTFLFIMLWVLLFVKRRTDNFLKTLLLLIAGVTILTLFKIGLVDRLATGALLSSLILIFMGSVVAFVVGREPLSIFCIGYIGYFIANIINYAIYMPQDTVMGGGNLFAIMIASGVLGVLFYTLATRVSKKDNYRGEYSFKGEASEEFIEKNMENDKKEDNK